MNVDFVEEVLKIPSIVITGGPCSGKTTGMNYLVEKLKNLGYRVFVVPEYATIMIGSGIPDMKKIIETNPVLHQKISEQMLLFCLEMHARLKTTAAQFENEKTVVLLDRGPMDVAAYCNKDAWGRILQETGLSLNETMHAFDGVIHLVTTADGAEEYYTQENNTARFESPEEAREADKRTQNAWVGHSHLKIIDNSTDFEGKTKRVFQAVCRTLGIPAPLEIERKYLLARMPQMRTMEKHGVQKIKIEQTYLKSTPGKQLRIRKREQDGSTTCYLTEKKDIKPGVRYETEKTISLSEYETLMKTRDSATKIIQKNRFCFIYNHQYFELDEILYPKKNGKKIILLEIELTEENDKINLPPFLAVEKDVTDDGQYANYSIAKL